MANPKTNNLGLDLIDRTAPTTTYLNLQTNLDDNWEKIDAKIGAQIATSPAPTPLNLGYGSQVVSVPRTTPYNVLNIRGRTLINLLGRDGNCEDLSKWNIVVNATVSLDTTNKIYGANSLKITSVAAGGFTSNSTNAYAVNNSKNHLVVVGLKNGNATEAYVRVIKGDNTSFIKDSAKITDTTKFNTVHVKITPAEIGTQTYLRFTIYGTATGASQVIYADGLRVYELTQAQYDELAGMTNDQIAAKYPYVDDMQSIRNPYVIKSGENLLPPFSEWTTNSAYTYGMEPHRIDFSISDSFGFGLFKFVNVLPNQPYMFAVNRQGTNGAVRISYINRDGSIIGTSGYFRQDTAIQFTTPSDAVQIMIFLSNEIAASTTTNGTFTFSNPMLNLGSTALPFKPKADDYLFFNNVQLSSNVDNTIYDTLGHWDGKYWKLSRFKTMDLDGSLPWTYSTFIAGVKRVALPGSVFLPWVNFAGSIVKYDGKILKNNGSTSALSTSDSFLIFSDGTLYLDIAAADSGWGDSYLPSAAEIQAYFNGWKMSSTNTAGTLAPYTGSGNKYWCAVTETASTTVAGSFTSANDINFVLNTPVSANGIKRYKLQYQLATPTVEEIAVEGDITLHEGLNQIEVGNGIIVREVARPAASSGIAFINTNGPDSKLKNRVGKVIGLYDSNNKSVLGKWSRVLLTNDPNIGNEYLSTVIVNYDPSAAYTVTYLALDQYSLTSNVLSIQGEYASNLKTVVDTLATNQADVATRVGVLENTKAQKVQPQWIQATLLNGWVANGTGVQYRKIDTNKVEIRASIRNGAQQLGTIFAMIPYKPTIITPIPAITFDGSAQNSSGFLVSFTANGELRIDTVVGSSGAVSWYLAFTATISLD